MKIYLVKGWYEHEGSEVIVATTSKDKAEEIAKENSLPWHYDKEDTVDRYHYDGIKIVTWENEEETCDEIIWKKE